MPITIQDVRDYYGAVPVWVSNHAYFVWFANCPDHRAIGTNLNCVFCRAGYWSKISNNELQKIQKLVEENNAKSSYESSEK